MEVKDRRGRAHGCHAGTGSAGQRHGSARVLVERSMSAGPPRRGRRTRHSATCYGAMAATPPTARPGLSRDGADAWRVLRRSGAASRKGSHPAAGGDAHGAHRPAVHIDRCSVASRCGRSERGGRFHPPGFGDDPRPMGVPPGAAGSPKAGEPPRLSPRVATCATSARVSCPVSVSHHSWERGRAGAPRSAGATVDSRRPAGRRARGPC